MTADTSATLAFVEYLCLSLYGYVDSFLITLGVRPVLAAANENADECVDPRNKIQRIEACLGTMNSVDLWDLRELALSEGGLLKGEFCSLRFVLRLWRTVYESVALVSVQFESI